MQGMAGRDPEFHIRPLLFQITSLPCPAMHCTDVEDYQARARIMNKAITTMRRIMMMILIIMTKIMKRMTMTVTIRPLLFQITSSASHGWRLKGDRRKLRRFDPGKENQSCQFHISCILNKIILQLLKTNPPTNLGDQEVVYAEEGDQDKSS